MSRNGSPCNHFDFPGGEMHPTGLPEPLGQFPAPKTSNKTLFCPLPPGPMLGVSPSGQVTLVQGRAFDTSSLGAPATSKPYHTSHTYCNWCYQCNMPLRAAPQQGPQGPPGDKTKKCFARFWGREWSQWLREARGMHFPARKVKMVARRPIWSLF